MKKSYLKFIFLAAASMLLPVGVLGQLTQPSSAWTILNRVGDVGNSELECYVPGNVSTVGGVLTLTASHGTSATCTDTNIDGSTRNSLNTPWYSGSIQTRYFNFTFGDVQFSAKGGGAGTWPGAVWLLGANCQASNPHSADNIGSCSWNSDTNDSGEIDIGEMKTNSGFPTTVSQNNCTDTTDHSGTCPVSDSTTVTDYTANFHVYEVKWTSTSITWFVDGVQTNTTTSNVPQHAMFIIANLAIGGNGANPPNAANFPQTLQVQWVKVCPGDGVSCSNGTANGAPTNTGSFWDNFSSTTAYGISIPTSHPRLLLSSQAQMNQAQTWFATHPFTPAPVPDGQTEGLQYALHYLVSGNTSDCTNLYNLVTGQDSNIAACSTTSNAGCDAYRWYGEDYCLAYDVCFNQLSSSQLSHLLSNMNVWVPANNGQGWGGVGSSMSNYYWGDLRNSAEWGIASYNEQTSTADPLLKNGIQTRYENDFIPATSTANEAIGGVFEEGNEYGPYGGFYSHAILAPSTNTLGLNLDTFSSNTFWPSWGYWLLFSTFPTPTVGTSRNGPDMFPFSDTQTWQNGSPAVTQYLGDTATQLAEVFNGTNEAKYLRQWISSYSPAVNVTSQASDPGGTASTYGVLPLDFYASGYKLALGRSDWTNNAMVFQLQMGDNYSIGHNHADWGTFQIYRKGKWLTRESPGYSDSVLCFGGSGSCDTQSFIAHQVPVINGLGGVAVIGGTSGQAWNGPPQVTRIESQPTYFFASDTLQTGGGTGQGVYRNEVAQPGHPERENTTAISVVRDTIVIKDISTMVVLDRLQSDTAARPKSFIIHCETAFITIDASHHNCEPGNSQRLAITTLLPSSPSFASFDEGAGSAPNTRQFRAEITDNSGAAALSYDLNVLQAMDTTGTLLAPTIVDNGSSWIVTLDVNHSLILQKGATSTGGSITINGSTRPLSATAQTLTINTSGLTWSNSSTLAPPTNLKAVPLSTP